MTASERMWLAAVQAAAHLRNLSPTELLLNIGLTVLLMLTCAVAAYALGRLKAIGWRRAFGERAGAGQGRLSRLANLSVML
ncbi:MAG: hypothetical protein JSR86_14365, partial [Proteobacteria bacterium]|nr:hypothetical protein [Pseudomonadota bacterium]